MMDSLLRALGFVPLSAPFVRTSQAESQWFLVQLSAPGVCLVCYELSYKHSAYTPHILSDGPSGQSMNFWAIIVGCLEKNAQLSWLILKAKFTHSMWKLLPVVQIAAQPLISQTHTSYTLTGTLMTPRILGVVWGEKFVFIWHSLPQFSFVRLLPSCGRKFSCWGLSQEYIEQVFTPLSPYRSAMFPFQSCSKDSLEMCVTLLQG